MKEAEVSNVKEMNVSLPCLPSLPINLANEIKLKQLEARLKGPNSDGNLPVEFKPLQEYEIEMIKSSKYLNLINFRNFKSK